MRKAPLFLLVLLALLAGDFASAQDAPKRKSGLWEITRTSTYTQDKPKRIQLCVDQASDNALQQLAEGMRGEACTTNKLSQDGDKLVVEATCRLRDSTAQTHAVISGKFDSAYTVESKSTYKPPLAGAATGHAQLVARWTGPCAAGQKPGERILDSGVIADSSGQLEAPKAKNAKTHSSDKNKDKSKGKHLSKTTPASAPGPAKAPNANSVAPAAKASAPVPKAKNVAPAPTGTPPAANPNSVAPTPAGAPGKEPAASQ